MITFREWLMLISENHEFSSTQINIPETQAEKILAWSKSRIEESKLYTEDDHGRETELHVTVLFGLHADDASGVIPVVQGFEPFELTLGKVSKFGSEKYDVLKIDVESPKLRSLNDVVSTLPHTSSFRDYRPHCTLAYVLKNSCDHLVGSTEFDKMVIPVDTILFSSKNRTKTPIALK
jgi:2'-5' RNA ligase